MITLFDGSGSTPQVCFVVADLDVAMAQWQQTAGVGPFHVNREATFDVVYRSKAMPLTLSVGLAQLGGVHVELIQQHGDVQSVYRDVYPEGEGGFHHVCLLVPDVDAAATYYEDQGFEIGMSLTFGETPVLYVDTRASIGCMTEVIRDDQAILDLFERVRLSAVNWDGIDPVRDMAG